MQTTPIVFDNCGGASGSTLKFSGVTPVTVSPLRESRHLTRPRYSRCSGVFSRKLTTRAISKRQVESRFR